MPNPGALIWRDFVSDGVPSSGVFEPRKAEIRDWSGWVESTISTFLAGGADLIYLTRSALYADLAHAANSQAWVVADAVTAYNGIYRKSGASGSGSWARVADLPYSFVRLVDAGAGTANAIVLTSSIPTSGSVMRVANVFEANTGNVTISENGAPARPLRTSAGNEIAPGGLVAGGMIVYVDDGANFRMLSDQASTAIQAAAEAAQTAAEDARDDLFARYLGSYASDAAATTAAGTPVTGQLYWNSALEQLRVYDGGWVSATQSVATHYDNVFTGDGTTTVFTLASDTASVVFVSVGTLTQTPGTAWSVAGDQLTLSSAPPSGTKVVAPQISTIPFGASSAGLITTTDAGGYFDTDTVEGNLQEIGEVFAPFLGVAPARPEDFGAVGDGVTNDTVAVQAALNAGKAEVRFDGIYKCDALTVATANKLLFGRGQIKSADDTTNLLTGTGLTDTVFSVDLYGSAVLNTTSLSGNDAITLVDCEGIVIERCKIEMFRTRPIWSTGDKRMLITSVLFKQNNCGPRFLEATDLRIRDSTLDGTCLSPTVFTTGIGLESTDGYGGRGVSRDVSISGVVTKNIVNAQGVLIHSGINVAVVDCKFFDAFIGISFNPYNSVDYIYNPIIANNLVEDYTGAWDGSTTGNSAVAVQAGGSTPDIISPIITGNIIKNGNRSKGGAGEGGIQIGYTDDAMVVGNTIIASWSNGIRAVDCVRSNFGNNNINTVVTASGQGNGIYATSCSGIVDGNFVASASVPIDASGMTLGTNPSIA